MFEHSNKYIIILTIKAEGYLFFIYYTVIIN